MFTTATDILESLLDALDSAGVEAPEGARRSLDVAHRIAGLVHERHARRVPVARMIANGATDDEIEQAVIDAQLRSLAIKQSGATFNSEAQEIARPYVEACRALAPKVYAALVKPYGYALDVATAWTHGADALDQLGPVLEANPDQAADIVKARQSTVEALAELDRVRATLAAFGQVSVSNFFAPVDGDAAALDLPVRAGEAFREGWLTVASVDGLEPKLTPPGERDDEWVKLDARIEAHNAEERTKGSFTRQADLHQPVYV